MNPDQGLGATVGSSRQQSANWRQHRAHSVNAALAVASVVQAACFLQQASLSRHCCTLAGVSIPGKRRGPSNVPQREPRPEMRCYVAPTPTRV
jgi:hypothetical protein